MAAFCDKPPHHRPDGFVGVWLENGNHRILLGMFQLKKNNGEIAVQQLPYLLRVKGVGEHDDSIVLLRHERRQVGICLFDRIDR